jgi:hypothetical protein
VSTFKQTIVGDNSSYADFQGWAGDITAAPGTGTGIAAALYSLGFTKLSDTYSAAWSTSTVIPTNAGTLFGSAFPTTTNNARAALSGTNFMGAWVSGSGTYVVGNVVTSAGQVWICTTNIASSSTAPASDTSHWSGYFMEIWSMVAAGLDTVYIKLEYGGGATATNPQLSVSFGSQYVSNSGVLSGNVSTTEQCFVGTGVATSSECDLAGDGQNWFAMFMHRANTTHSSCVVFERSISGQNSGAPVYSNGSGAAQYINYLVGFVGPVWHQCSLFLGSGVGSTSSVRNAWASVVNIFTAGSQIVNNITPCLPIFSLVGWVSNPFSAVSAFSVTDSSEGVTISSNVYGSATSYLTSINAFLGKLGGTASIFAVGIKWQ